MWSLYEIKYVCIPKICTKFIIFFSMLNAIKLPFLLAISGYNISRGTIKCQIARLILPVHQYETTQYTSNFDGHKNYSFLQKGNSCISHIVCPIY